MLVLLVELVASGLSSGLLGKRGSSSESPRLLFIGIFLLWESTEFGRVMADTQRDLHLGFDSILRSALLEWQRGHVCDCSVGFPGLSLRTLCLLAHRNRFRRPLGTTLFCFADGSQVLFWSVILHVVQHKNYMLKLTTTYTFRLQEASS